MALTKLNSGSQTSLVATNIHSSVLQVKQKTTTSQTTTTDTSLFLLVFLM